MLNVRCVLHGDGQGGEAYWLHRHMNDGDVYTVVLRNSEGEFKHITIRASEELVNGQDLDDMNTRLALMMAGVAKLEQVNE